MLSGTPAGRRPIPRAARIAGWAIGIVLALLLALAAFPWGFVAGSAAGPLSRLAGRPVTIARAHRVDFLSLMPTVELEGLTIGQPAGFGTAPLARIARARIRFAALPLLIGRFRPRAVEIEGARLLLLRDANGRANWDDDAGRKHKRPARPSLRSLAIGDTTARLIDAKRHIRLDAAIALAPGRGLTIDGRGTHRGTPLQLALRARDEAGPVAVAVRSPLARLAATVRPDRPFDFARFTARIDAGGTDLSYLDDILQAGLFPTRPFAVTATIRRDAPAWQVKGLAGTVGHSILAADLTVANKAGRTILNGTVDARQLDFDDFSSAEQRAEGAARRARTGPRVVPATRIALDHLGKLDGRVRLNARRLLSSTPSAFQSLAATATLDHRLLRLDPIDAGLRSGRLTGHAVVDHRAGPPRLSLDLRLAGARIERLLLPAGEIAGPLAARVRLTGRGDDVRAALARSAGRVGLAVTGGTARRDYMIYLGGDLLKSVGVAIGGNDGARATVRCLVADFAVSGGRLVPRPLVLDTEIARADGSGRILLADESIALSLAGHAIDPGPIQSTAPVRLIGTLSDPSLDIRPPRAERKGKAGILDRIGFLVRGLRTGRQAEAQAAPSHANCAALSAAALR
ncbi:AsmA family protein [Sphingomonas profundi]|uniref:AsmA family protein n=1 Tax=Alterirhizorhabdus profundi TaxID=2681549 RepID=UPI0018D16F9C|nr:AsmA family protein [Sphingomonas profundi]